MNIHFHNRTGHIMSYDHGETPDLRESHFPDHRVTFMMPKEGHIITIDAKKQKIDVITEDLIDKEWDEQAHAHMPTMHEIKHCIALELLHTDSYEFPSRQRRMGEVLAKAWIDYREKLRDLPKMEIPQAMIEAWLKRPNGEDAIPQLREAVERSKMLQSLES